MANDESIPPSEQLWRNSALDYTRRNSFEGLPEPLRGEVRTGFQSPASARVPIRKFSFVAKEKGGDDVQENLFTRIRNKLHYLVPAVLTLWRRKSVESTDEPFQERHKDGDVVFEPLSGPRSRTFAIPPARTPSRRMSMPQLQGPSPAGGRFSPVQRSGRRFSVKSLEETRSDSPSLPSSSVRSGRRGSLTNVGGLSDADFKGIAKLSAAKGAR
ncbi:hypothetical protein T484DRAFT_1747592 [Baffinella frigidus]|nr:hypothetical protein T484DRAFT_1747592 [Cryptophyta sp. CCMP2293]